MVTDVSDMLTASIFRVVQNPVWNILKTVTSLVTTFENRGSKLL